MKAYNTPKDELHIESDTGETLVSITPEKTTIANLEGGGGDTYDLVFESSQPFTGASSSHFSVVKGNFADAHAKLMAKQDLKVKVFHKSVVGTVGGYEEGLISYIDSDDYALLINFTFIGRSRFALYNASLVLDSEGTIQFNRVQIYMSE